MTCYRVEVTDQVRKEMRRLPGHMRQRVFRELQALREEPRPSNSHLLDVTKVGVELASDMVLCRIRITSWRIIYVVEEELNLVSVLAIRQRPPYQYDDLANLLKNVQS